MPMPRLLLHLVLVVSCAGQWTAPTPKRGGSGGGGGAQFVRIVPPGPRDAHPGAQFAGLDSVGADEHGADGAGDGGEQGQTHGEGAYALEFVEPLDGDTVSSTPFRVAMRTTGGFRVPDDGEIRLTMTYPGRGQDVRVLQSTEFRSWNVVGGDFTISAMLVSTKDEPLSEATTVQVKQERGAHFVLMQPLDGQLLLSRAAVPVVVLFGGAVPHGSRVCFDVTSAPPRGSAAAPHHVSVCTDDPGLDITEDQGTLRVNIAVPAGNCTLRAGVYDADRQSLTPEAVRSFRVVDEQDECPSGSGVACLHGGRPSISIYIMLVLV